jgi:hypothetical protein
VITFNNRRDGRVIANAAGTAYDPMSDVVVAHRDKIGIMTGGFILSEFTDVSCTGHYAGFRQRWGSRDLLWVAFHFPFVQSDLERMFAYLPETNLRALAFNQHLGFREIQRIPNVYRGGAKIVMVMERAECPWLALKPRTLFVRAPEDEDGRRLESTTTAGLHADLPDAASNRREGVRPAGEAVGLFPTAGREEPSRFRRSH